MVVLGRPIKANILGPPWAHNPMADFPLDPTTVFLFSMGKKRIAVAFLKHVRGLKKKKKSLTLADSPTEVQFLACQARILN